MDGMSALSWRKKHHHAIVQLLERTKSEACGASGLADMHRTPFHN